MSIPGTRDFHHGLLATPDTTRPDRLYLGPPLPYFTPPEGLLSSASDPGARVSGRPDPDRPQSARQKEGRPRFTEVGCDTLRVRPGPRSRRPQGRILRARHSPSCGPLAQLAEQQTLNLKVPGSIPGRLTTFCWGKRRFQAGARPRTVCLRWVCSNSVPIFPNTSAHCLQLMPLIGIVRLAC